MTDRAIRNFLVSASMLLLTLVAPATAVAQPGVRAIVQPASERKAAPQFALKDSTGKTINLTDYRGKVLLLDFWATWCTGCKMEIPWFSEFEKAYSAQQLIGRALLTGRTSRPISKRCSPSASVLPVESAAQARLVGQAVSPAQPGTTIGY
jgi:thiol-disulfide isomerase/thioredoxin